MENNKNTQYELNKGLAQMLKGGVIMDVTTPEQARIAEAAGAFLVFLGIIQQYLSSSAMRSHESVYVACAT